MTNPRARAVDELVARLDTATAGLGHPGRVAIDGITGSGKTTLAGEVAAALTDRGRAVRRLSMDGYHHPRAHRHRQGRDSAEGYYEDAYDLPAFRAQVLDPLGVGTGAYRPAIIDLAADAPAPSATEAIPADGVLVVDGSFLQREELAGTWDVVVWVAVPFEVAEQRGSARDADALGGVEAALALFRSRYHAAARRYLDEVDPEHTATIVFDNTDVTAPALRPGR